MNLIVLAALISVGIVLLMYFLKEENIIEFHGGGLIGSNYGGYGYDRSLLDAYHSRSTSTGYSQPNYGVCSKNYNGCNNPYKCVMMKNGNYACSDNKGDFGCGFQGGETCH